MSSEVEVYLSNMRGAAITVGKRTHVLLQPKWRPGWSSQMHPGVEKPTLGSGLIGLFEFEEDSKKAR